MCEQMTFLEGMADHSEMLRMARDVLRRTIIEAREYDPDDVVGVIQEVLHLAHFEITDELDDMRDELLYLGLTEAELDQASRAKEVKPCQTRG